MSPMATSPEVTIASKASGETPRRSTCRRIGALGRGALLTSTTAPPRRRNATSASEAGRNDSPAVVQHAPDVAQDGVVAVGDGA